MPNPSSNNPTHLFAWQGIQLRVPQDWNPGLLAGTVRSGHARLDDDDMARIEIRWQRGRSRADLPAMTENLIHRLQRAADKRKQPFTATRDLNFAAPQGLQATAFGWKADVRAVNLLSYCPTCKRITLLCLMGRPAEKIEPIADKVFASFQDHPQAGRATWAVYDLTCAVQEDFQLARHTLNLQRVELAFQSRSSEAIAAKFNLASLQLRNRTLRQWLGDTLHRELQPWQFALAEETYRGHPALKLTGRPRVTGLRSLLKVRRRFFARVWQCPDADKIYLARWASPEDRLSGAEPFCDSIHCHD